MAMINMSALDGCMLQWWWSAYKSPQFTKQCKLIVKLLLNVYQLGKNMCNQCTLYTHNSVQHILFECSSNIETRNKYWKRVIESCPDQLAQELNRMMIQERAKFLLNAMNCKYVPEWTSLYTNVALFIYCVYNEYYEKSKELIM